MCADSNKKNIQEFYLVKKANVQNIDVLIPKLRELYDMGFIVEVKQVRQKQEGIQVTRIFEETHIYELYIYSEKEE